MRKNQIGITVNRFSDQVPKGYEGERGSRQTINVYADANNIYEALAAAYYEALTAIQKYESLPEFGRREHIEK